MDAWRATNVHRARRRTRSCRASARCRPPWAGDMRGFLCATVSVVATMLIALPAAAQDVRPEEASATLGLRTSIKASALVFRPPDVPALFPERTGTESVWRLRVEPEVRAGGNAVFTVAYDQRLGYTS